MGKKKSKKGKGKKGGGGGDGDSAEAVAAARAQSELLALRSKLANRHSMVRRASNTTFNARTDLEDVATSLKETRLTAKMISSEAEREVKTIRSTHGDTMADMKTQLENALAELKSTQETLDRVRKESNRKTEAIESLTVKCSKLTLELRISAGEEVGGAT